MTTDILIERTEMLRYKTTEGGGVGFVATVRKAEKASEGSEGKTYQYL